MTTRFPKTAPVAALLPVADAQNLKLVVRGNFHVHHEHDADDRCGPKGATRQMDYTVTVKSIPALLDEQGFMIDWQDVRNYFNRTYATVGHFPSCEQIACQAVRDIGNLLPGKLSYVSVTVGFHGGPAEMTAEWQAPEGWYQCLLEQEHYAHAAHA